MKNITGLMPACRGVILDRQDARRLGQVATVCLPRVNN
jgi:hypothetical protein